MTTTAAPLTSTPGEGLAAAGLTKRYRGRTVVDDVSFTVRPGEVTGFLGPNGAGKSTTMRMLCGLSRPSAGSALLDGVTIGEVVDPGRALGALLDAGAFHRGRTVAETMRLVTLTIGLPASEGAAALELVGLGGVGRRRAGALSLGMRQRLGLAVALVGRPRYLVLDEPMNGLDAEGIGWVKQVLGHYARSGGGVLVSTHLIGEIAGLADRVVVIDRGRVVAEARPHELGGEPRTRVRSVDDRALGTALLSAGVEVDEQDDCLLVSAAPETVGREALARGIALVELASVQVDLADYVLAHTRGEYSATPVASFAPAAPQPVGRS